MIAKRKGEGREREETQQVPPYHLFPSSYSSARDVSIAGHGPHEFWGLGGGNLLHKVCTLLTYNEVPCVPRYGLPPPPLSFVGRPPLQTSGRRAKVAKNDDVTKKEGKKGKSRDEAGESSLPPSSSFPPTCSSCLSVSYYVVPPPFSSPPYFASSFLGCFFHSRSFQQGWGGVCAYILSLSPPPPPPFFPPSSHNRVRL